LPSDTLLDLGRAFAFLDSDAAGAAWYRAGIHKAERDDKDVRPGDPAPRRLLNLLDQTKALWRLKDYPALEQRFAFAMRWNPPLSPEARRAGYLHAEMLFYQKKYLSAADAMLAVQAAHRQAGDLGALERSDLHEMDWVLGLLLRQANRHEMAIVFLRRAGGSGGEHAMWATRFLFSSLLELGRIGDAQDIYNKYAETYHPSERARTQMQLELDTATPNVEPVRQQGGSVPALGGAGPMTLPQAPYKETVP
jgi:hypothetical protein